MIKNFIKNFLINITKFIFNILKIRICNINVERIGHLVETIFLYEILKKKENNNYNDLIFFSYENNICNKYLFKKLKNRLLSYKKTLKINNFVGDKIYKLLRGHCKTDISLNKFFVFDINNKKSGWENVNNETLDIDITETEKKKFIEFLKNNDINEKKYVCLNLWSFEHLKKNLDWSHHKYRLSDSENYLELINYILEEGLFIIALGHDSKRYLNIRNKKFINYCEKRSDILDVLLVKNCFAYISDATGLDYLANAFKKPMLINSPFLEFFFTHRTDIVYLVKRFYSEKKGGDLTLKEALFKENLMFKVKSSLYEKRKINIKENYPNDLVNAYKLLCEIIEKNKIPDNKRKYSNEFWSKYLENLNNLDRKENLYYSKTKIKSIYSFTNLEGNQKFI